MDANNICNCELCSPNWHLGEGDEFVPVPETDRVEVKEKAAGIAPAATLVFAD